jgi:hypothetical protein
MEEEGLPGEKPLNVSENPPTLGLYSQASTEKQAFPQVGLGLLTRSVS